MAFGGMDSVDAPAQHDDSVTWRRHGRNCLTSPAPQCSMQLLADRDGSLCRVVRYVPSAALPIRDSFHSAPARCLYVNESCPARIETTDVHACSAAVTSALS